MPTYVVLKDLPHGQRPGDLVDLNDDEGRVFLLVDAVRKATAADEKKTPEHRLRPREYHRRDLQAEG